MFKLEEFFGKKILISSFIDEENVRAFFTTRDFPLKAAEREDLIEEVERNKKLICEGLNIPLGNLVIPIQTHSDNIKIVTYANKNIVFENTDALITKEKNIAIVLNFADCVPIIFFDSVKKVAAIAHAGWRGTVAQIAVKTVKKMVQNFSCEAQNIIALIGPSIGKCCFEVKDDVKNEILSTVEKKYHKDLCNGNYIDLKSVNKIQLLSYGVKKIDLCEYCTFCQNELFFSYRKEHGKTARHSAVIILN
jgi:YfiH family protein